MSDKHYMLREDRLTQLLERERKLDALETAGVDNWEGYEHAVVDDGPHIDEMLATFPTVWVRPRLDRDALRELLPTEAQLDKRAADLALPDGDAG